jgi:thiopurine S-methyltransferase
LHLNKKYWESQYKNKSTNWDIGYASPPITGYIDQISGKDTAILLPGAGNGYEAEYLLKKGFSNFTVLDISSLALDNLKKRVPEFPPKFMRNEDFFEHKGKYDIILEQTFFCSLPRNMRREYAKKCYELLNTRGKLVGLLFNHEFEKEGPPFGGSKEEYVDYFSQYFDFKIFGTALNSIKPRAGREYFINFQKKDYAG